MNELSSIILILYMDSSLFQFFFMFCFRPKLYSATTVLVLTLGSGVDGFTLDPDSGKFLHTHKDIRIPSAGPIYSFNEANFHDFEVPVKRYLNALKEGSSSVGIR
jgi:fructose-1,6-bisphosphatase I